MKNKIFKKVLSVFTAMAMMVSVVIGNTLTAYAKADGIMYTPKVNLNGTEIYMDGYDTYIVDGTNSGTTAVYYYDNNGNQVYVNPNGAAGDDLSEYKIYSNGETYNALSGDVNIEMTGGSVGSIVIGYYIYGSGNDRTNVNVNISGGSCGCVEKAAHYGNSWFFSEQIVPMNQELTGYVTKTDSGWVAHGDAIIPEGKTVTVGEGEVFQIESGATLTNNGTIVNNGTINTYVPLNGTVTGNGTVVRNAICINDTASSITVYKDGEEYPAQTEVVDGKTYIYVPAGEIKVVMDEEEYYAKYSAEAGEFELESEPKGVTDFTNMPTEIKAIEPFTLSAGKVDEWFNTTVTYEISDDGGTGAVLDGNVLTAYRAGTIQVTVTAKDTYDYTFSKTYEIVVAYTPVSDIETIPSRISVGINYNLAGYAVTNNDATCKTIEWSVVNANGTGATITDNVIKATSEGTAVIRATVRNGQAFGEDYRKDYTIEFCETYEISVANGSITFSKKDENTVTITGGELAEAKEYSMGEYITIIGTTDSNTITISEGTTANVILSNVSISSSNTPIDIETGATLNLTLLRENTLTSNTKENAALHVPSGAKLVITDESTGSLNATGGANAAGIGGGKRENSGDVEIHGGTITAKMQYYNGSKSGAGIGGGYFGSNGSVTITGGYVNASATNGGAGIGAGYGWGYNGGTVTITGGTVIVSGKGQYTYHGAGIGGGENSGNGGTVVITGGNVQAIAGDGAEAIGKGSGSGSSGTLKDSAGNDISLIEITLDGVSDKTSVTNIVVDGSTYGSKDVVTIGDKLYLYLPVGTKTVTAGGYTYVCYSNGQMYKNHSDWVEATCTSAKHCSRCGLTEGETLPHSYVNGVCTVCGMDENGVFHIKIAEQLVAFAQYVNAGNKDAKAVLDADINMTGVAWTPICQTVSYHSSKAANTGYSGTFDGNGHTISYLTVTGISGGTYSYGLFGTVSGTVKELGMVNYTYTMGSASDARAGSIAGQVLTGGTITNCYSVGHTVTTSNNIAGGIAGCTYGGTISNCYALKLNGSVSGYDTRWGGVVGDCQKDSTAPDLAQTYGTVSNCYTDDTRVVSSQSGNATIERCAVKNNTAFTSGEIAYLLNNSTSTGNLVWYQNLSDDNNADSYPVLNDTHGIVYSVKNCDESATVYRNVNENEPHTDNNSDGVCDVCGGNAHIHEWTYTASNNTITAVCGAADCPATGTNTIVISASGKTYDGTAVTATVTNNVDTTDYSSSIVYKDNDGVVTEAVNAGTYTANLTVGGKTATVEFTIDEKAITVTADDKSKTYGEGDPTFTYTATGLEVNDTLTGTLSRETGENVGTYAITQGTLANPNYEITFVEGTFTINGVDISAATAVQNGTLTYDGTAQTPTFTVTLGNTTLTADDYDVIVTAQTNAGSYTATIEGKGNCEGTIADVAWEILPANIADTSITYAPLTYNGTEQTPVFTIKLGDYTLNASDYSVTVTAQINAGDYTAFIVGNLNFDGNIDVDWSIGKKAADEVTSPTAATITYGQTLSEATLTSGWSWVDGTVIPTVMNNGYAAEITVDDNNYDYTSIDGYNADTHKITRTIAVIVEKAAPTITTEPYAAAGLVYDGSAKVLVNEGAVTGGSFVYSLTGNNFTATLPTATEAKEYTVYWRVAGDENHNNSETFNFKVTIAKATPPALTIPTATAITYGEALSNSTLTTGWAWVDGTVIPTVANNGFEANIEVDDSNYDYTDVDGYNETVHTVTRTIAVTVNRAELTVTAESYTVKLGNPLPETLEYTVSGLKGSDTVDSIGADITIGYENGVTPSAVDDYNIVVSGKAKTDNYTITYVNGKLIITEKDIQEIEADDVVLTYGDTNGKITATAIGSISYEVATGKDIISVDENGNITILKFGTATVTITADGNADYAEATKTISVTVNKKRIALPSADGTEYTYTGTAQTYGVTSTDDYTVEGGVQTNAGEYPITITLNNENYEWDGTLGTYTFIIKQVPVTITAKSYTIKVGDTLPTYAYDVTGLVNNETLPIDVTISCNAADSNTAGTYTITVSGAANSTNYTFAYVNGTLTISNKLEQTITASNVTLTYGETGKKITATTNGNGAISYSTTSDVISVAADGTITALKAGTATVTVKAAETDNYAEATKTVTVTVNKAAVTITARSYTIKVGEALPTYAYDVTGLVNGETLPIDVTISCNVADSNTAGTYDIIVSGAATSDNYTFSYVKGTLTVSEKEVVAAPTFTPANGTTFTSSQKVTISCATAGAKIYYTTDGTEPTTASTLYNGAFTITTTTTIKAIAVKDGMTDSAVVTATYTKKSSGGGGGGGGYTPSLPTTPNNPEIGGKSASWATIASDISKLPIGSEITIELNGNYDVPLIVIKAIADREVKVTFVVDSTRSWYVDGAEIETPAAADLSILYIASLKVDGLRGDVGTKIRIDGTNIPTELVVALDKKHAGKFANLYKKKENELVFVDNIKVDENGKVILPVSEQGDYVIMLCEYSDRKGDVSNDGVTNALDASAILKDIVELEEAANPVMLDYNGDGKVNALDASAILKDIVNGKI